MSMVCCSHQLKFKEGEGGDSLSNGLMHRWLFIHYHSFHISTCWYLFQQFFLLFPVFRLLSTFYKLIGTSVPPLLAISILDFYAPN